MQCLNIWKERGVLSEDLLNPHLNRLENDVKKEEKKQQAFRAKGSKRYERSHRVEEDAMLLFEDLVDDERAG